MNKNYNKKEPKKAAHGAILQKIFNEWVNVALLTRKLWVNPYIGQLRCQESCPGLELVLVHITTPAALLETLFRLRQVMVKTTFDQPGDSGGVV